MASVQYTLENSPKVSSGYRRQPMLVGNLQVVGSILRPVDFGSGNGRGVVHVKRFHVSKDFYIMMIQMLILSAV